MRVALILLAACSAPPTQIPRADGPTWTYALSTDAGLRTLRVRLCFPELRPLAIEPGAQGAHLLVTRMWVGGREVRPAPRIPVDGAECVEYTVDLTTAARGDHVRVARPERWLWEPARIPPGATAHATAALPPGVRLSVPWAESAPGRYTLPPSSFRFHGRAVLGRFALRPQRVAGATIEAAVLGPSKSVRDAAIDGLLRDAARGVATVFDGRFPRPKAQVIVLPQAGASVGYAEAERGGGGAVLLMVGEGARYGGVAHDWTAVHEMLHLAMPQLWRGNAWLSEGVATYYQHLLLGRLGLLDPQTAWSKLYDGFRRGRGSLTGRTLEADSERLGRHAAYWRVYWAGAAWAYRADVALRRRGRSLDELLRFWRRCCPDESDGWNARPLLRRADDWLGEALLLPMAESALAATRFPDTRDLDRALGIEIVPGDSRVRLAARAPEVDIRRAILARRPP